jgi:hypothetical protein
MNTLATVATLTGICLAPFTAGASYIVVLGGVISGVAGSATNLITDVIDYNISERYRKDIATIAKEHDEEIRKLSENIQNISAIVKIMQEKGVSEDDAIKITLEALGKGAIKIGSKCKTALEAEKAMKAAGITKAIKTTGSTYTSTVGSTSAKFVLGKPLAELSKSEKAGIVNLIKSPGLATTKSVTRNVMKGVSGAVSVAFTVWEIKNLISDWQSNHPTVEFINQFIEKLKEEIQNLKSIYQV